MWDQIIDAYKVPGREGGVYCLGPCARRVSFSAQQNRALNLIWALHKTNLFKKDDDVAVIGAGVAGLTAAAGLIGYGCRVDIFEAHRKMVARQRFTHHRLVHPTVNQWPYKPLELTTALPFLEWWAGPCSEVTSSIADQFDHIKGSNRVFMGHKVIDIVDPATNIVHLHVDPRIKNSIPYRLVIIAIGFGEEKPAKPFTPIDYWRPDNLEVHSITKPTWDFLVSGCGDGGLIDALRLVHSEFKQGRLAFDVAAELSGTPLAEDIKAGEDSARAAINPAGLKDVYAKAASLLDKEECYKRTAGKLTESLKGGHVVYLVDHVLDAPFSLNAAPIHKLLIAHAQLHGAVIYKRGTPQLIKKQVEFAGYTLPAPTSTVIIRHGASPDFGRLLSRDEVSQLREKQKNLSDYHADKLWEEPFPVPIPLPKRNLRDPVFIESRKKFATRAIRRYVAEDADIETREGEFRVIYGGDPPASAPKMLFGIPVESHTRPVVKGIGG